MSKKLKTDGFCFRYGKDAHVIGLILDHEDSFEFLLKDCPATDALLDLELEFNPTYSKENHPSLD